MTFYLAAKYSFREYAAIVAQELRKGGHTVNAEWLDGGHTDRSPKKQRQYAEADLKDIRNSETFVVFQLPIDAPEQSTGRNIEFGYAYALRRTIILVGQRNSVFHYLPGIAQYDTVYDFLKVYG